MQTIRNNSPSRKFDGRVALVRRSFVAGALAFVVLATAPAGFGQATRTWVSGVGSDSNPCSRTAPCKTFAGAFSQTAPGGEIDALDPGGFGAVTITNSVTIDGGSNFASVLAAGVTISAGATDTVTLRNLSINGTGTGGTGINVTSAGSVRIENCTIYGFTNNGVSVTPAASTKINVTLKNVVISSCAAGVTASPAPTGTALLTAENLTVNYCSTGVSTITGATLSLDSALVSICTTAIQATGGTIRLSNTSIFDNTTGLSASGGGAIISFVNNRLFGNTTNGAPTQSIYQR
jgi:hypothetical protein